MSRGMASVSRISSDHLRCATSYSMDSLAFECSATRAPVRRCVIQSFSMNSVAMRDPS